MKLWRFDFANWTSLRGIAVAAILASALAFVLGLAMAPAGAPSSLERQVQASTAPVAATDFKDPRTVQVVAEQSGPRSLIAGLSGTITSSACTQSGLIRSGTSTFAIDGEPLINLATKTPLWRDLRLGDSGDDVRALQAELNQLGYVAGTAATVTAEMFEAHAALAASLGAKPDRSVIERSKYTWLPDREQSVLKCAVSVGSVVNQGQGIAELPPQVAGARITNLPQTLAPGERTLLIDASKFPTTEDGRISDVVLLNKMASTPSFAASQGSERPGVFTARYELAQPVRVLGVPPGAIFSISATGGCILSSMEIHRVTILGSQLGITYVSGNALDAVREVDLKPAQNQPCV